MKIILCLLLQFTIYTTAFAASGYNFCFIGDSRFVGMKQSVYTDENIYWLSKGAANYNYYRQNRETIANLPRDTIMIYELGINDLNVTENLRNLWDLKNMGFSYVCFVSVAPVDDYKSISSGYRIQNWQICDFNEAIYNNLPPGVGYIDSYTYLLDNISTYDGIHYKSSTYQLWLAHIINTLFPN